MHTSFTTRNSSIDEALREEEKLAANAYEINGIGALKEGIILSINHPQTGGAPALFVGRYFILRHFTRGPLYRTLNEFEGLIRRMDIDIVERDNKAPLRLLTIAREIDSPPYLLINTSAPEGVTPKERFLYNVELKGSASLIRRDGPEFLVCFLKDGDFISIFYADGTVRRVVRSGKKLQLQSLSLLEQADCRIKAALASLDNAHRIVDEGLKDERIKKEDMAYHQLCSIIAVAGNRADAVYQECFAFLVEAARVGNIRPGVKTHASEAISKVSRKNMHDFLDACEEKPSRLTQTPIVKTDSKILAQVRSKKERRREKDRQERAAIKGLPRPGDQAKSYSKKKK